MRWPPMEGYWQSQHFSSLEWRVSWVHVCYFNRIWYAGYREIRAADPIMLNFAILRDAPIPDPDGGFEAHFLLEQLGGDRSIDVIVDAPVGSYQGFEARLEHAGPNYDGFEFTAIWQHAWQLFAKGGERPFDPGNARPGIPPSVWVFRPYVVLKYGMVDDARPEATSGYARRRPSRWKFACANTVNPCHVHYDGHITSYGVTTEYTPPSDYRVPIG